jgi:hypothetical protein
MKAKLIEGRDRATFIPLLAIQLTAENEAERYLLRRSGWSASDIEAGRIILMCGLCGGRDQAASDPYDWVGNRTRQVIHGWLESHFDEVESGQVLDAEFLLGESSKPKESERRTEEWIP